MGNYTIRVTGESYHNNDGTVRQEIISECEIGENIRLVREPTNPYDKNAIEVHSTAGQIGYIDRKQAHWISRILDDKQRITAKIWDINKGAGKSGRVVLKVRTGEYTNHIVRSRRKQINEPASDPMMIFVLTVIIVLVMLML